jgi:hypothetical protein
VEFSNLQSPLAEWPQTWEPAVLGRGLLWEPGRFGDESPVRTTIAAAVGIPGKSLVEIDVIAYIYVRFLNQLFIVGKGAMGV